MNSQDYFDRLEGDEEYQQAKSKIDPYLNLADDFLNLRLKSGLTQTELARRTGTKQANVSRVESGIGNPTMKFLEKIAEALNADLVIHLEPKQEILPNHKIYRGLTAPEILIRM